MKKTIILLTLGVIYSSVTAFSTYAAEKETGNAFSVGLTPSVVTVSTHQPNLIERELLVENFSNHPVILDVTYQQISLSDESGKVTFTENSPELNAFLKHITLQDEKNHPVRSIQIAPKMKQKLTVKIDLPANSPDGSYLFSILLKENTEVQAPESTNSEEAVSFTTVLGGIAANFIVDVGKTQAPVGRIDTFYTPTIAKGGPIPFTLKIANTGNQFIRPQGSIKIKNIFGQTVGKVELPERIILAGKTRIIEDQTNEKLDFASQNINSTAKERVIGNLHWRDPVFFGPYTAVIEISLEKDRPPLVQSVNFFVFPAWSLIISIAVVIFLLWLTGRVRKHL